MRRGASAFACVLSGRETILWRRLYESSQRTSNNVVIYLELLWFQYLLLQYLVFNIIINLWNNLIQHNLKNGWFSRRHGVS